MKRIKTNKIGWTGDIAAYIFLLIIGFLLLYPVIYMVFSSFKSNAEIYVDPASFIPKQPTFENYKKLFTGEQFNFFRMLKNTVIYSGTSIISNLFLITSGAYVFARGDFPGKKTIFTIFTSAMFIGPGAIAIYCTFDIVRAVGLEPNLYTMMGVHLFSVPIVGYYMVKGYIDSIPRDMDDAAKIDGCGFIRTFFAVVFPMLKPMLATQAVFSFQGTWNAYLNVLMWTSSHPEQWTFMVGVMNAKNSGDAAIGTGFTLAAASLSIIPVIAVYAACNKMIVENIAAGAVKG